MKAFARWRFRVWDTRLNRRRAIWDSTLRGQSENHVHPESPHAVETDRYWEAQVTKAMAKRTTWRKRAGIELRRGGPVQ